jgi:hypothetical protein
MTFFTAPLMFLAVPAELLVAGRGLKRVSSARASVGITTAPRTVASIPGAMLPRAGSYAASGRSLPGGSDASAGPRRGDLGASRRSASALQPSDMQSQ